MAERTLQDSGQDGRSVLGMLAVQVERDAKTGAAVIRSVGPVTTPSAPVVSTVFDDGRRSIHTVGGSEGRPSDEELGQVLSAIDSVGKKLLLDEISVTETKMADSEVDRVSERKLHDSSKEKRTPFDGLSSGSKAFEDGGNMMVVRDTAGREVNMEEQNLEDAPVTLLFLGYTDPDPSNSTCLRDENNEDMLTVERVFITDEGEEQVLGPESPSDHHELDEEARDEDVLPVNGNKATDKVQGGNDLQCPSSASDGTNDGVKDGTKDGIQKHRRCECCSVM